MRVKANPLTTSQSSRLADGDLNIPTLSSAVARLSGFYDSIAIVMPATVVSIQQRKRLHFLQLHVRLEQRRLHRNGRHWER